MYLSVKQKSVGSSPTLPASYKWTEPGDLGDREVGKSYACKSVFQTTRLWSIRLTVNCSRVDWECSRFNSLVFRNLVT